MKVTAKADYAVRAVTELAIADGRLVKADLIAAGQGIPRHFLDNILNELRRAEIVVTQRGAEGGSRLARPPAEITVADILRAVEGPLAAVRDHRPEQVTYEGSAEHVSDVWIAVRAALRSVLEAVTVEHLVSGKLPRPVAKLLDDPEAWKPH